MNRIGDQAISIPYRALHTRGSDDSQAQILVCEGCGDAYHMDCVSPPLSMAPPGGFYCRRSLCRRKSGATKRLSTLHSTSSPISDELESPLHSTDRLRPPRRAVAWEELAPSRRYAPDAHTKVSQRALQSAKQNLRHGLLLRKHLESAGFFAEGSGDTVDFTGVLYKRDTIDDGSTAPSAWAGQLDASIIEAIADPEARVKQFVSVAEILDTAHPAYQDGRRSFLAFSKCSIRRGTVLGFYGGITKSEGDESSEADLDRASCQFALQPGFYCDADHTCNELAFANDFRLDVYSPSSGRRGRSRINAEPIMVWYASQSGPELFPRVAYVTTKAINKGDEIFIDYGEDFWCSWRATRGRGAPAEKQSASLPFGTATPAAGARVQVEFTGQDGGVFSGTVMAADEEEGSSAFEVSFDDGSSNTLVPGKHRYLEEPGGEIQDELVCSVCHSTGALLRCECCATAVHPHCADPPLAAAIADAPSSFYCAACSTTRDRLLPAPVSPTVLPGMPPGLGPELGLGTATSAPATTFIASEHKQEKQSRSALSAREKWAALMQRRQRPEPPRKGLGGFKRKRM